MTHGLGALRSEKIARVRSLVSFLGCNIGEQPARDAVAEALALLADVIEGNGERDRRAEKEGT